MNYQETIDYLFHQLPMFSRIGAAAIKKDLDNTIRLCEALGNPHQKLKTIHVAGTNGKGSTSHMLAAILQTAGYKTGLYTSPHLKDFRERIKVNGQLCDESFVVEFTEKVKSLITEIEPSFFEITVAMAFEYFVHQNVDIAVIEVGLGGRLDSTNIITPELSVITNIGFDHMNLLGNTLDKIAFEKAGIIKQNIPVVVGETLPETKPVFIHKATAENAPLIFANEIRWISNWKQEHEHLITEVVTRKNDDRRKYELDLCGFYQTKNLLTVLEAVHQLRQIGFSIDENAVLYGLKHSKKINGLHGRWEIIHHKPKIILDVGHNEDGIKQIVEQIEHNNFNHLHVIIGMVKDKEVEKALTLLPKYASYYFTQAHIPRALNAEDLRLKAQSLGLEGKVFANVNEAIATAKQHAKQDDLILVCGSVFLVGEVENNQ